MEKSLLIFKDVSTPGNPGALTATGYLLLVNGVDVQVSQETFSAVYAKERQKPGYSREQYKTTTRKFGHDARGYNGLYWREDVAVMTALVIK